MCHRMSLTVMVVIDPQSPPLTRNEFGEYVCRNLAVCFGRAISRKTKRNLFVHGGVAQGAGLANQARGLTDPVLIQQVADASHRHLQDLGSPSLIAARALKRANYVVFFELCQVTFKIDSFFRQIEVGHRSRLIF